MFKPKHNKIANDFRPKMLKRRCILSFILTIIFAISVTTVYAVPQIKIINIVDDGNTIAVLTNSSTVKGAIKENNISVSQNDEVYPSLKSLLFNGMTVSITRSKKIYLKCDGAVIPYTTLSKTFGDFLVENDITLSDEDTIDVDLDAKIPKECTVTITRIHSEIVEVTEDIPYTSSKVNDSNMFVGETKITQYGVTGTKQIKYEAKYVDGELVSTNFVGEYIKKSPVNEVISVGIKQRPPQTSVATVAGNTLNYKKVLTCSATAYDLSFESTGKHPGSPNYGLTASGTYAKVGTVAVDPSVIPLGTKMYIVSTDGSIVYGYCTAEDTGGAIKGNKVDLFYNTTAECLQFGRRNVYVYIL